jgi:hypothetical protein
VVSDRRGQSWWGSWRGNTLGVLAAAGLVVAIVQLRPANTPPSTAVSEPQHSIEVLPGEPDELPSPPTPVTGTIRLDLGERGRLVHIDIARWSGSILGVGLYRTTITVTAGSAEANASMFSLGPTPHLAPAPGDNGCLNIINSGTRDGGSADPKITVTVTVDALAAITIRGPGELADQTVAIPLAACPHAAAPPAAATSPPQPTAAAVARNGDGRPTPG